MFIPLTQYSVSVGVERQWFGGSEKQAFIFTIINDSSGSPPQCGFSRTTAVYLNHVQLFFLYMRTNTNLR